MLLQNVGTTPTGSLVNNFSFFLLISVANIFVSVSLGVSSSPFFLYIHLIFIPEAINSKLWFIFISFIFILSPLLSILTLLYCDACSRWTPICNSSLQPAPFCNLFVVITHCFASSSPRETLVAKPGKIVSGTGFLVFYKHKRILVSIPIGQERFFLVSSHCCCCGILNKHQHLLEMRKKSFTLLSYLTSGRKQLLFHSFLYFL